MDGKHVLTRCKKEKVIILNESSFILEKLSKKKLFSLNELYSSLYRAHTRLEFS